MRKTDWKAYIAFSKKDRIAAIVLLGLIVLIILAVFFYNPASNQPGVMITTLDQELAKQGTDTSTNADGQTAFVPTEETEVTNKNKSELFLFDPNTLDAAGFKRLGLPDKTINTIIKYRSKGGHFYKADDLRKIYGLRKEDADRLIPYVQTTVQQQTFGKTDKQQTSFTKTKPAVIDINTATAEQWKALPAIGDALANRIIKFRDKMGGYKSVAQVKQTYGLSDSAFKVIEPYLKMTAQEKVVATGTQLIITTQKANTTSKININTASVNQLKSNPYIPEEVAQAMVIYRSQHGNYAKIEDIKKIVFINEEMFKQIAPYISVE